MSDKYQIRFSKVREKRGQKPWGVFEDMGQTVYGGFSRGISQHDTREEAEAALAVLKQKDSE